jgi:hypothetical protein
VKKKEDARQQRDDIARSSAEDTRGEDLAERPAEELEAEAGKPQEPPAEGPWRAGDPTPQPILPQQPAAEPKDLPREAAGAWTTPPPGQTPPGGRNAATVRQAKAEDKPKVIDPSQRAPQGWKRYKIRADIPGEPVRTLYILAKDEQSAKDEYARSTGLDRTRKAVGDDGKLKDVQRAFDLVVTELPD